MGTHLQLPSNPTMFRQFPANLQHLAQSNELDLFCDAVSLPQERVTHSTPCHDFKGLLKRLGVECPQLLNNCIRGEPSIDLIPKFCHIICSSANSDHTLPASPDYLAFESFVISVESSYRYPIRFGGDLLVLQQIAWVLKQNRLTTLQPIVAPLHHLCILLLEPIISKNFVLISAELRRSLVTQLLENVVFPPSSTDLVKRDVFAASLQALRLFLHSSKLPNEAATIIQPILSDLCAFRLDLRLVEALARTADIFPALFNQRFSGIIRDTLNYLVNPSHSLSTHAQVQPMFVKLFQVLCSIGQFVDCSSLAGDVCQSVATFVSKAEECHKLDCFELLLRFLDRFPSQVRLIALVKLTPPHELLSQLRAYAPHSSLWLDFVKSSDPMQKQLHQFYRSDQLADVTLIIQSMAHQEPQQQRIPANKIILQLRSPFFKCMFTSGFQETSQNEAHLGAIDAESFEICLKHMHGIEQELGGYSLEQLLRAISMADYLGLDDLYRKLECDLCGLVAPCNVHKIVASPVLTGSCWAQRSSLHISPLTEKCRRVLLDNLRDCVDMSDQSVRELVCFGL
eukprot:c9599_g1_i1.p1 GENE.c9599_g1_i1~~c9599_g1_i1.p1  ORF type:complete len:569 (-),score=88.86 c9599_g1_i1:1313-3019(-)